MQAAIRFADLPRRRIFRLDTPPIHGIDFDYRRYDIDLAAVTELWRRGSVVSSWLLDLTAEALKDEEGIAAIAPHVADSGEGRWTLAAAIDDKQTEFLLTSAASVVPSALRTLRTRDWVVELTRVVVPSTLSCRTVVDWRTGWPRG